MEMYETQEYGNTKLVRFIRWFEENIGTEYEVNEIDDWHSSLTFFELTSGEIKKIRKFENEVMQAD